MLDEQIKANINATVTSLTDGLANYVRAGAALAGHQRIARKVARFRATLLDSGMSPVLADSITAIYTQRVLDLTVPSQSVLAKFFGG